MPVENNVLKFWSLTIRSYNSPQSQVTFRLQASKVNLLQQDVNVMETALSCKIGQLHVHLTANTPNPVSPAHLAVTKHLVSSGI